LEASLTNQTLFVTGAGLKLPQQITIETLDALLSCNIVLTVIPDNPALTYLRNKGLNIVSISGRYVAGRYRPDIYNEIADIVLMQTKLHERVAYLTEGNPFLIDSISTIIVMKGREFGINVIALPAVSSIDCILTELSHDIINTGIQIYEASWAFMHNIQLNKSIPALLMQVNVFGTAFASTRHELEEGALGELQAYLGDFYPRDHICISTGIGGKFTTFPISHLSKVSMSEIWSGSMFLPPTESPKCQKIEFYERMASKENHLEKFRQI
jgi:tetrapyrrole methylase family protein/MazG family protein